MQHKTPQNKPERCKMNYNVTEYSLYTYSNFLRIFGRGKPQLTETADSESAVTRAHLYLGWIISM
jgi:hypothetical protein